MVKSINQPIETPSAEVTGSSKVKVVQRPHYLMGKNEEYFRE